MQMQRSSIALFPLTCTDFINYIFKHHRAPTTLIVCSTREIFLEELISSIRSASQSEEDLPSSSQASDDDRSSISPHLLLVPTIHLIAKSHSVNVVFIPSLPHLRANLSTAMPAPRPESRCGETATQGSQAPLLAIWGLARLHRFTAEYSAQDLSHTLASAVEAAAYRRQRLVLAEPREISNTAALNDADASEGVQDHCWREQVPLLSGSLMFAGEDRIWAGKTIAVGMVVAKWCKFVKLDLEFNWS